MYCAGSDYDGLFAEDIYGGNGTFDIAHVSVVEGDATDEDDPFGSRHISQELDLCKRYYREIGDEVDESAVHLGRYMDSQNFYGGGYSYPKMRAEPTVTLTYAGFHKPFVVVDTVSAISTSQTNNGGFVIQVQPTTNNTNAYEGRLTGFKAVLDAGL